MPDARPLRFAIVGTGPMARLMAEDIQNSEFATVATVVSRDRDRGRAFAHDVGARRVLTVDELTTVEADVVYIATPHDSHAALAVTALTAGAHVLVEKAFAMNAREAQHVANVAQRHKRFLMEAMWMCFNPAIRAIQTGIEEGRFGEPRTLTASFGRPVPYRPDHRLWNRSRGGGTLLDQAVYPLTLADLLFGAPARIDAAGSYLGYENTMVDVDTEASILLGYDTGAQASSTSSIRAQLSQTAYIGTDSVGIEVGPAFWCPSSFLVHRPGSDPESHEFRIEGRGYLPMLRAVRDAIRDGELEHPLHPPVRTVRVLRVMDEARRRLEMRQHDRDVEVQ
jgi:predicted dehydrogenase